MRYTRTGLVLRPVLIFFPGRRDPSCWNANGACPLSSLLNPGAEPSLGLGCLPRWTTSYDGWETLELNSGRARE